MRKFSLGMAMVLIALTISAVMAQEAQTEGYKDRYLIALHTYENVLPSKYNAIYEDVRDRSAKRTMVDAARDACLNSDIRDPRFYGPDSNREFDCATDFR